MIGLMKFTGKVIQGERIGQKYGFPTANIVLYEQIDPGIYAGRVTIEDKVFDCAVYVGSKRPDILEAHLLNFEGDLYGKNISVEIIKKIRHDRFFTETDNIPEIIKNDIKEMKNYFASIRN